MAQQFIKIESSQPQPNFVTQCMDPDITGLYSFAIADVLGVVAATNYASLFNPVGSGKTLHIYALTYSVYITSAGATTKSSMIVSRANTIAAGTLQAASAINKFNTTFPNSVAEVRTANPTAVLDGAVIGFPPGTIPGAYFGDRITASSPGGSITLLPGEGIVWRDSAGNVNDNFNISFTWSET